MHSIKLILIGDVHYPEHQDCRIADVADSGFNEELVEISTSSPITSTTRIISELISADDDVRGLLITGDITSWGKVPPYAEFVKYLNDNFDIRNNFNGDGKKLHVVPGNHDLLQSECNRGGGISMDKFLPFRDVWQVYHDSAFCYNSIHTDKIDHKNNIANIIAINSCVGCGEYHGIPDSIKTDIYSMLDGMEQKYSPEELERIFYEQINSPSFSDDDSQVLFQFISHSPQNELNLILSHHNILPQTIPRFQLYAELINAGSFRTRLLNANKSILYCHGHLHDDPSISVIDNKHSGSRIVSIASPKYIDGFILIEIAYSVNNYPIGLMVKRYRYDSGGILRSNVNEEDTHKVSLFPFKESSRRSTLIEHILDAMNFKIRYSLKEITKILRQDSRSVPKYKTFVSIIEEAEWLDRVEIMERNTKYSDWLIRKT